MDIEYYEQESHENDLQLIKDLAVRTAAGTIDWKDVEYNPMSVLGSESEEGTPEYILTQMFSTTAELSGIIFDVELSENMDILTGKGDIYITITKTGVAGFGKIDITLSGEPAYDDTPMDMLLEAYKEHPILVLADELVDKLYDTDEVRNTFEWASFISQDIPSIIKGLPIFQLGERLFEAQDVLGFHKCVMDVEYRDQYMAK